MLVAMLLVTHARGGQEIFTYGSAATVVAALRNFQVTPPAAGFTQVELFLPEPLTDTIWHHKFTLVPGQTTATELGDRLRELGLLPAALSARVVSVTNAAGEPWRYE